MSNEMPMLNGINMKGQAIINLAAPSAGTDAANRDYVYDQINATPWKKACRLKTTTNINLANPGTSTFDGTTAVNGDRILVTNQNLLYDNGPYVFNGSASAMTRVDEVNTSSEVIPAMAFFVTEGSVYHDTMWVLTTNPPYTLGTTGLIFEQHPLVNTNFYTATITAISGGSVQISHNFGTRDCIFQIQRNVSPWEAVQVYHEFTDINTITAFFGVGITGDYRVKVWKCG